MGYRRPGHRKGGVGVASFGAHNHLGIGTIGKNMAKGLTPVDADFIWV
jgi:hypothetical protein